MHKKEMFEQKFKKVEESLKQRDEQIKTLKIQKDKLEGQSKVLSEQLDLVQTSHEELSTKKANEVDLLSREIS